MLDDFSLCLSTAMIRKKSISVVKTRINQAYELFNYLDALKSNCILQLYSWNAAKALKAWLIKKRYPKEVKKKKDVGLHSLIWNSIQSLSPAKLNLNQEILTASLCPKE